MIKDGSSKRDALDKVFLDEEYWGSGLLVAICLICNSLIGIEITFNLTYGGVKVKIPSLGTLTPLPILRFRLM